MTIFRDLNIRYNNQNRVYIHLIVCFWISESKWGLWIVTKRNFLHFGIELILMNKKLALVFTTAGTWDLRTLFAECEPDLTQSAKHVLKPTATAGSCLLGTVLWGIEAPVYISLHISGCVLWCSPYLTRTIPQPSTAGFDLADSTWICEASVFIMHTHTHI